MVLGFGIRDPGSGKNHSGSRIQGSKRHRITDPGSATLGFGMETILIWDGKKGGSGTLLLNYHLGLMWICTNKQDPHPDPHQSERHNPDPRPHEIKLRITSGSA
jgi:hypothetical protein